MAFDTFFNTDWQGNDKVPSVTVTFAEPVDLRALYVYPGSRTRSRTSAGRRSSTFDVPRRHRTQTIDLEDVQDKQRFELSPTKVGPHRRPRASET